MRRGPRSAGRGRGSRRGPPCLRLRRPRRPPPPDPAGADPMSTGTPIVDQVEDLWPSEPAPEDTLDQLVLASHLLGANRAVSNFGGGNTSAKGTATDHAGRERPVIWVKGSGSDLATMGRAHFTGLRLDEVLPLMEREEMRNEERGAYLAPSPPAPGRPRGQ